MPCTGVLVVSPGGVVVSTFEWEQNIKKEHWSEGTVLERLRELLSKQAANIWERSQELDTDLRRAAFITALERLEESFSKK